MVYNILYIYALLATSISHTFCYIFVNIHTLYCVCFLAVVIVQYSIIMHSWIVLALVQPCGDVSPLLQCHVQPGRGVWGLQGHWEGCVPAAGREGLQVGCRLQE